MSPGLLIVDDHVAIAEMLAVAFRSAGFEPVVIVPASELDAGGVVAAARRSAVGVALVDLHLGGVQSGVSLIRPLVSAGLRVVALTARTDEIARAECLEAGAAGFLNKGESIEVIVEHLRRVARGDVVVPDAEREVLLAQARSARAAVDHRAARFRTLTAREREVLGALARGSSVKEIAAELGIAVRTVRSQVESIRFKLDVRTQLAAVAAARETGWEPD